MKRGWCKQQWRGSIFIATADHQHLRPSFPLTSSLKSIVTAGQKKQCSYLYEMVAFTVLEVTRMTALSGILITVIFVHVQVIDTRPLSFSACNTEKLSVGMVVVQNVHESSKGFSSITIPKPKGMPPPGI